MPAMDVYRVRVSHQDADHHMSDEAFYGPAFDSAFRNTLEAATGEPCDLAAQAQACADRCRGEHPDADGYTTRVVRLIASDPDANGETTGTWEEVA